MDLGLGVPIAAGRRNAAPPEEPPPEEEPPPDGTLDFSFTTQSGLLAPVGMA